MNGDIETLQRLGDVASAVVPFVCNKVNVAMLVHYCFSIIVSAPTSIVGTNLAHQPLLLHNRACNNICMEK